MINAILGLQMNLQLVQKWGKCRNGVKWDWAFFLKAKWYFSLVTTIIKGSRVRFLNINIEIQIMNFGFIRYKVNI